MKQLNMLKKIKVVFGGDYSSIKKKIKRLIFKKIILKVANNNHLIINILNWIFRIKFNINLKEKLVYDKLNHKIFYSYSHRNMFFVEGIEKRLIDLQKQYLTNQIKLNNDSIVIDCGANIGEFSLAVLKYNHKIKLYCFEPEEREFEILKKNLNGYNANIFNMALANYDGQIELFSKNASGDSSIIETEDSVVKKVKCIMLSTFFASNKITECTLLKLEAEGAEPEILEGASEALDKIKYISVECGPERGINQDKTILSVHKLLKKKFDLIDFSIERDVLLFKNSKFE